MKENKNKSTYTFTLFIILTLNIISGCLSTKGWKQIDKQLDNIENISDQTLINKYNHDRIKELTGPLLLMQKKTKQMVKNIRDDNTMIVKRLKVGKKIDFSKLKHQPKTLKKQLRNQKELKMNHVVEKKSKISEKQAELILEQTKKLRPLKDLIPNLNDPKYQKVEKIEIPDVVINETEPKPGHPLRKILIQKLIVLNTDDDDPSDNSIFVEKAVIDPSIYRTKSMEKLKVNLFKHQGKIFNTQLDQLNKELNNLKISGLKHRKTKKSRSYLEKKIQHIKNLLSQIKVPVVPNEFKTKSLKKDMDNFEKHLETEIKKIEGYSEPHSVKNLLKKSKKLSKISKFLKDYFSIHESPKGHKKVNSMMKLIKSMSNELKNANKHNIELIKKMKSHQKTLNEMLKVHKAIVIGASEAHGKVIRKLAKELKSQSKN